MLDSWMFGAVDTKAAPTNTADMTIPRTAWPALVTAGVLICGYVTAAVPPAPAVAAESCTNTVSLS
jgi:hypothetical protein